MSSSEKFKVLLFGKTGEGKSTVANMLVSGNLDNPKFDMGDGMSGVTNAMIDARGRGYYVVDTVGLGEETESERSNAKDLIYEYLKKTRGEYSHIIFVKRAGRFDELDKLIWKTYKEVFRGAEAAFMMVVTHCSNPEKWLAQNRKELAERYGSECQLAFVNFPATGSSAAMERLLVVEREQSLQRLEAAIEMMFTRNFRQYFSPSYAKLPDLQLKRRAEAIWNILKDVLEALGRSSYWQKLWQNLFR